MKKLIREAVAVRVDLAEALSRPPSGDDLRLLLARAGGSSAALCNTLNAPLNASGPVGYKCADCAIDGEPCPACYQAWWVNRHPNVRAAQ